MEYIFPSSHFQSICVLGLKWVSCRQHIYGSCFCIHSASLCLLVGAFNPFTFKVIIDTYVPIVIFLEKAVESRAQPSNFTFNFHFHALEKEMATHSSILAWRIPGMEEPGGLPSMGSHRVGHD